MTVNQKRPVNLDLTTLKFPPMAIVSIFHRISGVALFLLFPLLLCDWGISLRSADAFAQLLEMFATPYYKLVIWVFCSALIYHALAGIRHIVMDLGFGESLVAGRRSALMVMGLVFILVIFLGFWLW